MYNTQEKRNTKKKGGMFMNSKVLDYILLTLVIIGAVNWGLIGFFRFDLVAFLFGDMSWVSRIVYALVGIGGIYLLSVYGRIRSIEQA
jgi:Uncharacterized conserved protein